MSRRPARLPAPLVRSARRRRSGATIVEFALILPVLCMMLLGTLDLGYRSYVNSVVQGALHDAARMATVGGVTTAQIQTYVQNRLQAFSRNATITTTTRSYSDYSGVKRARDDHPGHGADRHLQSRATASRMRTATASTTPTAAAAAPAAPRTWSISRSR